MPIVLLAIEPVSTTPGQNFATSSPCVVDTSGKFATGVNDTGGKFAAGVNDAGGKLPPVSTTLAALWPNKIIKIFLIEDFFHLSLTPVATLELWIYPRIFEKIRNDLNEILWGWEETDSWKKPEAKNLVTLSL